MVGVRLDGHCGSPAPQPCGDGRDGILGVPPLSQQVGHFRSMAVLHVGDAFEEEAAARRGHPSRPTPGVVDNVAQ